MKKNDYVINSFMTRALTVLLCALVLFTCIPVSAAESDPIQSAIDALVEEGTEKDEITSLNVYGSITSLEALEQLPALQNLYIHDKNLTKEILEDYDFTKNPVLDNLNIYDAKALTELDADSFKGLDSLVWLSLYGSGLTQLSTEAFINLTSLECVDLDSNPIASIDEDFLDCLPNLYSLDLRRTLLDDECLENLGSSESLTELYISNTLLKVVPSTLGSRFPALKYLDISDNLLREIEPEAFDGLLLEGLYIYNCFLTELPDDIFKDIYENCNNNEYYLYIDIDNNLFGSIIRPEWFGLSDADDIDYTYMGELHNNLVASPAMSAFFSANGLLPLGVLDHLFDSSSHEEDFAPAIDYSTLSREEAIILAQFFKSHTLDMMLNSMIIELVAFFGVDDDTLASIPELIEELLTNINLEGIDLESLTAAIEEILLCSVSDILDMSVPEIADMLLGEDSESLVCEAISNLIIDTLYNEYVNDLEDSGETDIPTIEEFVEDVLPSIMASLSEATGVDVELPIASFDVIFETISALLFAEQDEAITADMSIDELLVIAVAFITGNESEYNSIIDFIIERLEDLTGIEISLDDTVIDLLYKYDENNNDNDKSSLYMWRLPDSREDMTLSIELPFEDMDINAFFTDSKGGPLTDAPEIETSVDAKTGTVTIKANTFAYYDLMLNVELVMPDDWDASDIYDVDSELFTEAIDDPEDLKSFTASILFTSANAKVEKLTLDELDGVIDDGEKTITFMLESDSDKADLSVEDLIVSFGASFVLSGDDFTADQTITVTAADGMTTNEYTIVFEKAPDNSSSVPTPGDMSAGIATLIVVSMLLLAGFAFLMTSRRRRV